MEFIFYDELDSTNNKLMEMGRLGAAGGSVVSAKVQTSGKGTNGRSFHSPQGGLYFSVLLRNLPQSVVQSITPAAAVLVKRELETISNKNFLIKPINDIYLDGLKVCGILTQAHSVGSKLDFVVIGIGINLFEPASGFPKGLSSIAGSVLSSFDEAIYNKALFSISKSIFSSIPKLADRQYNKQIFEEYYKSLI